MGKSNCFAFLAYLAKDHVIFSGNFSFQPIYTDFENFERKNHFKIFCSETEMIFNPRCCRTISRNFKWQKIKDQLNFFMKFRSQFENKVSDCRLLRASSFFFTFAVYIFIKYYYIRSVQKEFMKTHKQAEVIVLLFLLKIFKTSVKVSLLNDLLGIVAQLIDIYGFIVEMAINTTKTLRHSLLFFYTMYL